MKVLYTCDNNYVWLMGISTISLFENNKHIKELEVYLIGDKISDENNEKLEAIAHDYNRHIIVLNAPDLEIPTSLVSSRWPKSAFIRLFSDKVLPKEVEKVLYLDCDTIVCGDIEHLEHYEMNGNVVCGVKDCISKNYKKNIGLDAQSPYINAGVLLIDLKSLRNKDLSKKIDLYMKKYEKFINYADQDILNGALKDEIGVLSSEYNVMTISLVHKYKEIIRLRRPTNYYSEEMYNKAINNPAIIHYTTNMLVIRPWFSNTNHPLASEFEKYFKMSAWNNKKLEYMKFKSKESLVLRIIDKLPKRLSCYILGVLHAEVKPRLKRILKK